MDAELAALQGLLKKAKLLPCSAPLAGEKKYAPAPAPAASKQQRPAAKNSTSLKKFPTSSGRRRHQQQQQHPVQRAAAAKTEVPKKRRPEEEEEEELARAAAREEFRQMLLEMERSALPDETIYPEDLEELGVPFESVVTRTWKQALLEDRRIMAARHMELVRR